MPRSWGDVLDAHSYTCLYVVINTDLRSVMPNTRRRVDDRRRAALPRAQEVRERAGADALVLTRPGSVNWVTGGVSDPVDVTAPRDVAWVVLSEGTRALVTTGIEAPRLARDFDVEASGWELVSTICLLNCLVENNKESPSLVQFRTDLIFYF